MCPHAWRGSIGARFRWQQKTVRGVPDGIRYCRRQQEVAVQTMWRVRVPQAHLFKQLGFSVVN